MKDQRTSYGTEDKHSSVQQIRVLDVNAILLRKTGPIRLVLYSGSYSRLAGRQNAGGSQNLHKLKPFGFSLCLISVQLFIIASEM